MDIRRATTVFQILSASRLYDAPANPDWARRFHDNHGHHLFLAYGTEDRASKTEPIGFVSGVETVHPDKGTEMLLYELGVAEPHRRRGVGTALVHALAEYARSHGCYGMWVGVDPDNEAALATYAKAGARDEGRFAMLGWAFRKNV
ncbi:GNAT family N-acetyltransferase [Streptomyces sp. NA04227]|uniref:GNAT family N-acetyltransferase n=1 Tax=Streptomyces sp. NA04227 TaxID=2742136 RepID=UPI00158FCA2C|nr:GNAT family N-acetyltransferase [Streptomyces sp. NA04227]QKW06591.1 GNAT family N-acetyltransferase [Streptomyces sp. NA04227]